MNSIFRISLRNFSQLPKAAFHGFDARLNFAIQSLSNCNSNQELARAFHITTGKLKEEKTESRYDKILRSDPTRDRSKKISVETSIQYLQSEAYKKGYGDDPVWKLYRRNHKGQFPPEKTRKMCIRNDVVVTGNPCPICRDEYLVVDYRNIDLLKQFISPYTGEVISYQKTGVCQQQYQKILVAYLQARDLGLITFDVPFREYDYAEYELK